MQNAERTRAMKFERNAHNRELHDVDAELPTLAERGVDFERLLRQHSYTPQELSELLDMGAHTIRRAAREGRLPATIVGDDIVSINRADVLTWLKERG
jgi:excisionase family DNA binding protein